MYNTNVKRNKRLLNRHTGFTPDVLKWHHLRILINLIFVILNGLIEQWSLEHNIKDFGT